MIFIILQIILQLSSGQKLLQAQILIRHGARNQIYKIWNPQNQQNSQDGYLTATGIRQHYLLGKQIRKQYIDEYNLISSYPNQSQFTVQSTDLNRTLMSAQSFLYGLFKQEADIPLNQNVSRELTLPPQYIPNHFQNIIGPLPNQFIPIPIHNRPQEIDYVLMGADKACPIVEKIQRDNINSDDVKNINKLLEPFFAILRSKQLEIYNISQASQLSDDIRCNIFNGYRIPNLSQDQLEALNYTLSIEQQIKHFKTYDQTRLQSSAFIKQIINNMEYNLNQPFHLYSAHDLNILNILNLMNVTNWKCIIQDALKNQNFANFSQLQFDEAIDQNYCQVTIFPSFASNLVFELWESQNAQKYIQLKYNGINLKICDNEEQCSFEKFIKLLNDIFIPQYKQQCQINLSQINYNNNQSYEWYIIFITAFFLFISTLFIKITLNFNRKYNKYSHYNQKNISMNMMEMIKV